MTKTICKACDQGRVRHQCAQCHQPLHKSCSIRLSIRPGKGIGKWTHFQVCEHCAIAVLERVTGVPA